MANIRKSFNLRNGVQVDEDKLFVNSLGNVGLGTTVPSETLDVRGNIKTVGVVTAISAFISGGLESTGVSTFTGNVHVGSAITMYPSSGIISATSFRGDGASLLNIIGMWEFHNVGKSWITLTVVQIIVMKTLSFFF